MSEKPVEVVDVAKNVALNIRMADSDLAPLRQAAEAADLNMSTVVRETLIRYGQATIVELVRDRDLRASGSYNSSGKRRLRRSRLAKTVPLAEMASWKFQVSSDLARKWIALGRVTVDGAVVGDPNHPVPADEPERVEKASG